MMAVTIQADDFVSSKQQERSASSMRPKGSNQQSSLNTFDPVTNIENKNETDSSSFIQILTGTWKNELSSVLQLKASRKGKLYGKYSSAVGKVNGTYPLVGFYEIDRNIKIPTIGFIVHWHNQYMNAHANTAWSGFLYNGKLVTQWILSSSPTAARSLWASTNIGHDTFTKQN